MSVLTCRRCTWRKRAALLALAGTVVAAVLVAGSGSAGAASKVCPSSNPPNMLKLVAGALQTAKLGKAFQTNLQVALANSNGCPLTGSLAGISVTFVAPGGDASGTFASSGSYVAYTGTDSSGTATAPTFTANDTAGSYGVYAESDYGTVRFDLDNTAAGVAASIAATGQADQAASVNSQYGQPLQVQVLDANGRPVQGVSVAFSLGTGATGAGASFLGGGGQATATTKANGQATSPPFVANGSPGRFTATASISDIATVATYSLDNHAATNTITSTTQAQQTATVDGRYRLPLQARVLDASGQPIEGVSITFTFPAATSGAGASFPGGSNQASELTDAAGQATSPPFVANATPGSFTATASVTGITNPIRYPLRNLAARLTSTTRTWNATVDHRYTQPLTVRILDEHGQPVDGATVNFTIVKASGGATATFPDGSSQATASTNSDGRATSPALIANNNAGSFTATATLTGSPSVRYSLRNLAGKSDAITAGAADGESTQTGSRFPIRLAVAVTDKDGNPVPDTLVRFSAPAGDASGSFPREHAHGKGRVGLRTTRVVFVRTDSKGFAIAPPFTANATVGGYVVTASAGGRRAAFALINSRQ